MNPSHRVLQKAILLRLLFIQSIFVVAFLPSTYIRWTPPVRVDHDSILRDFGSTIGRPRRIGTISRIPGVATAALPWNLSAAREIATNQVQSQLLDFRNLWLHFVKSSRSILSSIFRSLQLWNTPVMYKILWALVPFCLGVSIGRNRVWDRFPIQPFCTVTSIPDSFFGPNAPLLKGTVVAVSDGDTFRFRHTPLLSSFWDWIPKRTTRGNKQKVLLSDETLPIRICTIDTPETPKFGKPGQPFGKEAKEALKQFLNHQNHGTVQIRLLRADQYGRAVAQVMRCSDGKWADEFMLKEGLAEVYEGSGAVYGPKGKDFYLITQAEAKQKKVGIWSQEDRESAADYKKRTK